jgi:hypothetical protein
MELSKETIDLIEAYVKSNWAKAPLQSDEDADYIQQVAINAVVQCFTDPSILQSVKGNEWISVEDRPNIILTDYHWRFKKTKMPVIPTHCEPNLSMGVIYYKDGDIFRQSFNYSELEYLDTY